MTGGPARDAAGGRHAPLRRNRDFNVFWGGRAVSVLGNALASVALPLLVLDATGSVAQMGLVTATTTVGTVTTGLFAGHLVDRYDRRRLMVACDLARALLFGLVPLSWLGGPQVWLLYAVAAAASVFSMVYQVAYVAAVADLVDAAHLTEANGRLQTTSAVAGLVGPALAGVLSAVFGAAAVIGMDAASFALCAGATLFVRLRPVEPAADGTGAGAGLGGELSAGVRFLWGNDVLRTLTVLLAVLSFMLVGVFDLFVYHLKDELRQSDFAVGCVLGAASAGGIAAGTAVPPLRRAFGFGPCWLISFTLSGVALLCVPLARSAVAMGAVAVFFALGTTAAGVCSMALRQQITPSHLLGRVTSAFWTLHSLLGPLGAALLTAAAARYGVGAVSLACGAAFLAVTAIGSTTSVRRREPGQAPGGPGPDAAGATR